MRDHRIVACVECGPDHHGHDVEDCTPVESDGEQVYICSHHVKHYTCDLCGAVEYTPQCRSTRWCAGCFERMGAVAEDIIDDFLGIGAQ